jgi:hypothetical protein
MRGIYYPSSVKNQRFLPASPQGEAFAPSALKSTVNPNFGIFSGKHPFSCKYTELLAISAKIE